MSPARGGVGVSRSSASDLRLQWSSASGARGSDPAALERLMGRVAAALSALEAELAAASTEAERAALSAEIGLVRAVDASVRRSEARHLAGEPGFAQR